MPIKEYMCKNCGKKFEIFILKSSDSKPTNCEYCDSKNIKKIISKNSFRLKGKGWYETDYKKEKKDNV